MTDITITLGNRPDLDPEERKQRARHAKEVLNGASWLFDEHISDLTKDLIGTNPGETIKRETLYHQIDAATQLKGRLMGIVQIQEAEEKINERKHRGEPDASTE